jgi:hypothetical protein
MVSIDVNKSITSCRREKIKIFVFKNTFYVQEPTTGGC